MRAGVHLDQSSPGRSPPDSCHSGMQKAQTRARARTSNGHSRVGLLEGVRAMRNVPGEAGAAVSGVFDSVGQTGGLSSLRPTEWDADDADWADLRGSDRVGWVE